MSAPSFVLLALVAASCVVANVVSPGWTLNITGMEPASAGISTDGSTVYSVGVNHFYAVDIASQTITWTTPMASLNVGYMGLLAMAGDVILAPIYSNEGEVSLCGFAAATGALLWTDSSIGTQIRLLPSPIAGGLAYVSTETKNFAIHPKTGATAWSGPSQFAISLLSPNGKVLVLVFETTVSAYAAATGSLLWTYDQPTGQAVLVSDVAVVLGGTNFGPTATDYIVLDTNTGAVVMQLPCATSATCFTPGLYGKDLTRAVLLNGSSVVLVDLAAQQVLLTFEIDLPYAGAMVNTLAIPQSNTVAIATGPFSEGGPQLGSAVTLVTAGNNITALTNVTSPNSDPDEPVTLFMVGSRCLTVVGASGFGVMDPTTGEMTGTLGNDIEVGTFVYGSSLNSQVLSVAIGSFDASLSLDAIEVLVHLL